MGDSKYLTLAVAIGEELLRNGAEIYRVEDSIARVLKAYEVDNYNVYVLANGIFVSIKDEDGDSLSEVRHVPLESTHLGKIVGINQLVRDIGKAKYNIDEARQQLDKCKAIPETSLLKGLLFCAIGIGAFTYIFGGTLIDVLFGVMIGVVEQLCVGLFSRFKINKFITIIFGSMTVALLSTLLVQVGVLTSNNMVVIGGIMPLLPGVAFTTSIRELYNKNYVSGLIKLADTLLSTMCIAIGIYIPIVLTHYLGGIL